MCIISVTVQNLRTDKMSIQGWGLAKIGGAMTNGMGVQLIQQHRALLRESLVSCCLGLLVCSASLEILNDFIYEHMFYKWNTFIVLSVL